MNKQDILNHGLRTLDIELESLRRTKELLNDSFIGSVEMILECKGRVVVTGMGKSGLIGKKIAATLASTGTPSFFVHPAEGVHGDIGMIVRGDVVLALSNSGETDEIKQLLPTIKRLGVGLISIVGNPASTLAKRSDYVLDASIEKEACPLNLAPTASTTVSLALGDALAVALVECRGFKEEDFALLHPSGALGKRLLLTVMDVMVSGNALPIAKEDTCFRDAVQIITEKRLGCVAITNSNDEIIGIITDGDVRRATTSFDNIYDKQAKDVMTKSPKMMKDSELAASALRLMETHKISSVFIVDDANKLVGLVHLQDILQSGIV